MSTHEIAWYAWTATKDSRLGPWIASGEVKNVTDLCYQTLALADIDSSRYRELIQKNVERLFSCSGQMGNGHTNSNRTRRK